MDLAGFPNEAGTPQPEGQAPEGLSPESGAEAPPITTVPGGEPGAEAPDLSNWQRGQALPDPQLEAKAQALAYQAVQEYQQQQTPARSAGPNVHDSQVLEGAVQLKQFDDQIEQAWLSIEQEDAAEAQALQRAAQMVAGGEWTTEQLQPLAQQYQAAQARRAQDLLRLMAGAERVNTARAQLGAYWQQGRLQQSMEPVAQQYSYQLLTQRALQESGDPQRFPAAAFQQYLQGFPSQAVPVAYNKFMQGWRQQALAQRQASGADAMGGFASTRGGGNSNASAVDLIASGLRAGRRR